MILFKYFICSFENLPTKRFTYPLASFFNMSMLTSELVSMYNFFFVFFSRVQDTIPGVDDKPRI